MQGKRHEFSKLIFWLVWFTNLIVILYCFLMMYLSYQKNGFVDFAVMNLLIPATSAEVAAATGFYYWKTKANNIYEYGEKFILDLVENDRIDTSGVVAISQAFFNSAQFNALSKQSK